VDFSDPVTPFDQFEAIHGGSLWA
jgi:hypothetical protein